MSKLCVVGFILNPKHTDFKDEIRKKKPQTQQEHTNASESTTHVSLSFQPKDLSPPRSRPAAILILTTVRFHIVVLSVGETNSGTTGAVVRPPATDEFTGTRTKREREKL